MARASTRPCNASVRKRWRSNARSWTKCRTGRWPAQDRDGLWKVVLCFRIRLESLAFTASDECVALEFFDAPSFDAAPVVPQTRPLLGYLRGQQ